MVKIWIIVMTFCWSLNSMAQRDYTISYYPYVNNAEMAIIDEKYALALKYYEFAFGFVENGFARDYLNAAYCAIEISQYSLAISYLEKLVAKGVPRKYFERNKQLAILYGHGFEEFLENVKSIREQTFEHTENRLFYGRIGQMENLEQEFRLDFEKNRDTIRKIDISNAKELFQMIDNYGFPSEEAMGLEDPFNPLAGYSHLLLVHAIKNRRVDSISYPDFIGPIREAVTNGRLNNQLAAQYLDLTNSAFGGLGKLASTEAIYFGNEHDTLYILSYDSSKILDIDKSRKEIGLCSLVEQEAKMKYHFIKHNRQGKFKLLHMGITYGYPSEVKSKINVKPIHE